MKLYISCQINSFVDFQYQVYPKCVPSQCNDVNDKKLELKNGRYCVTLTAGYAFTTVDKRACNQWSYSCDKETFYTTALSGIVYAHFDQGVLAALKDDVTTKFDINPIGDQFQFAIKGGNTCLKLLNNMFQASDCVANEETLFSWV